MVAQRSEVARHEPTLVLPAAAIHDVQSNAPWVLVAESGRVRRRQVDIGKVGILERLQESAPVIPTAAAVGEGAPSGRASFAALENVLMPLLVARGFPDQTMRPSPELLEQMGLARWRNLTNDCHQWLLSPAVMRRNMATILSSRR